MKKILSLLTLATVLALHLRAAPPSQESVEKMLVLAKVGQMRSGLGAQLARVTGAETKQVLHGQPPTAAEKAIIADMNSRIKALLDEELSWDKIKPVYIKAYSEVFTQEQIDALIAFYKTPAGQAFAEHRPEIDLQVQAQLGPKLGPLGMKVQMLVSESLQKLRAEAETGLADLPPTSAAPAQGEHIKKDLPNHISHGAEVALVDYLVTGKTTIVDFYSEYCPPCRELSPHLDDLHKARNDIAVVEVDINRPGITGIDWASPVAQQYHLHSIPQLRVYDPDGTIKAKGEEARTLVDNWIGQLPPRTSP